MTFGLDLQKHFESKAKDAMSEEEMFKNLIDSFKKIHGENKVYNFHGNTHQVEFNSGRDGKLTRELCDLAIISYSSKKNEARITFLQNKKQLNYLKRRNFKAEMGQVELLSKRPEIKGVNKFKPHKLLLKEALLPSIGSYGVFYTNLSKVHMYYSVAKYIEQVRPSSKGMNLKVKSKGICNNIKSISSSYGEFEELEACETIADFGNALLNMRIGSPIAFISDTGKACIYNWIKDIHNKKENNEVLTELLEMLSGKDNIWTDTDVDMDEMSVLIIKVD